jgi:tRNA dimethylallyltransferase
MIQNGLVQEVRSLLSFRHLNALQTVGYKELFEYIDNKISVHEAVNEIKYNTKHYAKRQMTWFKKDKSIYWVHAANYMGIVSLLKSLK